MKKMTENFKHFLFVIVLVPALLITSNIFANDSQPSLKIVPGKNNAFTLISNNAKKSDVTIRIFDNEGLSLLREKIEVNSAFSKSYDLSNMPNGIYEVEIEDNISFRKYFVITASDTIEILENNEEKIFKPIVVLEESLLKFNLLNLGSGDVELSLNNRLGEKIYTEKIQNTIAIHKGFDLSKLPSGNYSVEVRTEGKYFSVDVNLK
ncbi:MAG: T9SS type A sorting domain-containing protein [Saprospiraceae bacterium]